MLRQWRVSQRGCFRLKAVLQHLSYRTMAVDMGQLKFLGYLVSQTLAGLFQVTEMPNEAVTAKILGVEVGDTDSSILTEENGIFTASNEMLIARFGCDIENIPIQLPLEAVFTASSQTIISFNDIE